MIFALEPLSYVYLSDLFLSVQDQFDTIDLSDNEIVKLENFPYLNRLGTLLINNNRITRINLNLGGCVLGHKQNYLPVIHCLFNHFSSLNFCRIFTKIAHTGSH